MRMIPACWRTLVAGAALALTLSPALAAPAGPAPADKDNAVNPVEKLRKDLDKPLTIKIEKQPLSTAVDLLREKTKINFVLDSLTIQQQLGFTPDQPPTPVEVDLKDVKTRAALRMILSPYGLSFAAIGDTVIITTDDMAMMRQLHQRVSVDMDKVDFAAALKQISHGTAVNLIVDARVEKQAATKVTLQMEDVPLETAVRLLAEMAGLKPVRVGNVLFVTSKENANEMRNDPDLAQPNPNVAAQQAQLQQLQIQAQLGGPGGIAVPGGVPGAIVVPPGVVPVVPPVDPTAKPDKSTDGAKSTDDTTSPAADKKDAKEAPPPEPKPK